VLAATTAAGVVLAANVVSSGHAAVVTTVRSPAGPRTTPPSAARVELELVGAANAEGTRAGGGTIAHASCVQGSPGSYACSFVRREPGRAGTCAVAILSWTPDGDSTYTVVTAGRVALEPGEWGR
jgi:hypothetical protein